MGFVQIISEHVAKQHSTTSIGETKTAQEEINNPKMLS